MGVDEESWLHVQLQFLLDLLWDVLLLALIEDEPGIGVIILKPKCLVVGHHWLTWAAPIQMDIKDGDWVVFIWLLMEALGGLLELLLALDDLVENLSLWWHPYFIFSDLKL